MSQSDDKTKKLLERAEEARLVRRIVMIALSVIIVLIIGGASYTYFYINHGLKPVDPKSDKQVIVTIPSGTSNEGIGKILEDKGIIRNATIFHYYCKYKNETGFMAGVYKLSPSMSIDDVIDIMENGKTYTKIELKLVVPEGLWLKDIAARIAKQTNLNEKDILTKMADRDYIKTHYMKDYPFLKDVILDKNIRYPLEGYLFPATYEFTKKNPDLDTIIKKMLDKTQSVLNQYQGQIKKSKLGTVHKVLTMASVLEGEAQTDVDRRKIAGIFYNRIEKGMPLQSDMTALYGEGVRKAHVTYKDVHQPSPYNTYLNKNLPIGPINNPGEASIAAVLNPIQSKDLYFYARPNGKVLYAETLAQHNANVSKYRHEWDKVKKGE